MYRCTGSLKGTDAVTACPVTGILFIWEVTKFRYVKSVQLITSS